MDKLYVVVRADLSNGAQAVQSCHAALNFCMEFPALTARWFKESNHLALLSVPNEDALLKLFSKAALKGIPATLFREPDLDNSLTAIALEPGDRSRRLCSGLPLTLP